MLKRPRGIAPGCSGCLWKRWTLRPGMMTPNTASVSGCGHGELSLTGRGHKLTRPGFFAGQRLRPGLQGRTFRVPVGAVGGGQFAFPLGGV